MVRDPVTGEAFIRIVGRRERPTMGHVPTAARREALATLARYRTKAPKGVFIYRSHQEMDADRTRWTVEAVVTRERMADVTRPATWEDVKLVARSLNAAGAKWALIGGYAIAAQHAQQLAVARSALARPRRPSRLGDDVTGRSPRAESPEF